MNALNIEKGKIDISALDGPVPIVRPRLMRVLPSNIARVIGNFDEIENIEA
ncbi:MAG: hypothetical protein ACYC0J_08260 [Gammaproteobacteria bacterium]